MGHWVGKTRLTLGAVVAVVSVGCGSSGPQGFGAVDGGTPGQDATLGRDSGKPGHPKADSTTPIKLGGNDAAKKCVPSTCTELKATCGAVTDPKCGGVVQCGTCSGGKTCGGGGVHNQCGFSGTGSDACVKETCATQKLSCGQAGDGCGGTLSCGACAAPQICGGDPAKPGQCGCTGTCAQVPSCDGGTTTLTGKVYDPAGVHGLYNALVYVPNNPSDPGLQPFPAGITCDICGATAAGDPLVTAMTAPDGTFTLTGVPVGAAIPLVIQLGRWRRQFTIDIATPCAPNSVADKTLEMPSNHTLGDMPRIAMVTGSYDPVECVLRKIGIDDSEFTNPGGGGYINFFTADDPSYPGQGAGAVINASTPTQNALFAATDGGGPLINNYDITVLECEGYPQAQSTTQQAGLATYTAAGGRVFASDFQYVWFWENPALKAAANWGGNHLGEGYGMTATIDLPPTNPTGSAFKAWLQDVGISKGDAGTVTISPAFPNVTAVTLPTQQWLHGVVNAAGGSVQPIHFTFNTPIEADASAATQCGRVTFSDWHAQSGVLSGGTTFPGVCAVPDAQKYDMTSQEAILEFMLFDLSACVQPYKPICTGRTCADQNIQCGPAGDGCGNEIQCGSCPTGQTCGGGGAGKCGSTTICTPETCASQQIQCGAAGDGCGGVLQCGNCPTGAICGINTPGQCGTTTK
jgi:hypothetical protein